MLPRILRDTGKSPGTTSIPAERLKAEVTSRRAGAELSGGGALPTQLSCKPSPLAPRFLPTPSVQISAHIFSSPQVCISLCISIHPHLTLLYVPAVKISASLPSGQGNEIPPSLWHLVPGGGSLSLSQHKPSVPVALSVFMVYWGSFSSPLASVMLNEMCLVECL